MICGDCNGRDPECFLCDGTGVLCDRCGEPESACECEPGGGPTQKEKDQQQLAEEYWAKRAEAARRVREDLRLTDE